MAVNCTWIHSATSAARCPTYLDLFRVTTQTVVDGLTARMSATPGIEARDVTVTYRNGHTALHDASFTVPMGTITALVGVNGAGKSTLFKTIMGFVPAARGEIRLLGRTVREALKANLVAYVPQSEEVDWSFPVLVEDVVMMGRYGHMGFLRRAVCQGPRGGGAGLGPRRHERFPEAPDR